MEPALREDQAATKRVALDATRDSPESRGQCSHLAAACDALSQGLILIDESPGRVRERARRAPPGKREE